MLGGATPGVGSILVRLVLITNQDSGGSGDPERLEALLGADGAAVEVLGIDEHARTPELRPDRVVVAGGDGSIGPVAAVCSAHDLPLAVVPTGTANDFARALGLPSDLEAAAELARSPSSSMREVELHRAAGRPFLNAASTGLSVDAAAKAHGWKAALGPLAYAVGAVRAGTTSDPVEVRVAVDGQELFAGTAWQVIVAGTGAFGGGSHLEVADPGDGLLDVAVVPAGGRAELLKRAVGMRRGDLVDQEGVVHATGTRIEVHGADRFNVDGEVCDVPGGAFTHDGERVHVVVPAL